MKKRMLSLMLTMALLLSFAVAPAYAAETVENTTPVTDQCPCGCGKTLAQVTWKSWDGNPKEGHYYLDGNFTQAEIATVLSDTTVVIDLRGWDITTAGASRLFLVNGYLHILDTVGGGRMMAKGVAEEDGGVIMVEENESIGPAVYLHSGTITQDEKAEKVAAGGIVYVGGGATFCMKGGLLLNGNTNSAYGGGCVGSKVSNSHIQILGGKIVGGTSSKAGGNVYSAGKVTLGNCTIVGGNAGSWGGNVYVTGESATLEAKNVTIANGISRGTTTGNKYGGGNICVYSGAKATLENCEIYGGYAACAGGNVCLGRGTTTLKNCNIYGGSCGQLGENVYGALSTAKATINGGAIDGGFYHGNSKLTLQGALKVNGMILGSGTLTTSGLKSGAEITLIGNKTFTGTASYFKAGTRTALTASGTNLTATLATNGAMGYCSQCQKQVVWTAYGSGDHCYLTENVTNHKEVTVNSHQALDLAGFTLDATGRAYTVAATGDLLITDTAGTGILTGSDLLNNAGKLTLMGGKYIYKGANNGIITNSGDLTVNNALLDATAFENTEYNGGAISLTSGANAKLTMVGGAVLGGTAHYGGGVYACEYNTVNITSTQFIGGKGTSGGCFYALAATAAEKGDITITGASFTGGEVTTNSGSIYIARYDARITDCYISGGKSDTNAGNLSTGVSTDVVYTNCIIKDGYAASNGGNIYGGGNSTDMTFRNCLILNGKAASKGGNIYLGNGETAVYGGIVAYGKATSGGNISSGSDDKTGLTLGENVLLTGGIATTSGGNVYVYKITNLNDVHIQNGSAPTGADLHFYSSSVALTMGEGVTGNIHINATSGLLTKAVYGGAISQVVCNAKNANFYMDGAYGNCGTVLKDSTLYVASASVVDSRGAETWFVSNAEAVAACDENSFLRLYTDNTLVLTKDIYADLNGHTVAVSGNYKLYGMDSTGDGYTEPAGSATGTTAATYDVTVAPNGNTYIAIVADGAATYHRLNMKITGVNVRPSANGMYYTAKWYCDDTLKALVDTYGVVASTADMPDVDFASKEENLYTVFSADSFASGEAKNGAVISGVMKERTAAENDKLGKTPIYAKAYLTFTDGTTLVSNDDIRYSLYDVMCGLDKLITEKPNQYRKFTTAARNFYETWKENGMASWDLTKIPTPTDDGIIDLLMIGNSYCVYYVEELYGIAASMGVDMRICYVYYSGCPIEKHYNWWKEGQSNYHYYETYSDGKKFKGRDVSLEWCLAQREWDVITMNFGGTNMRTLTAEQHLNKVLGYSQELFGYFRDSFPNAELYMHQTWAFELGYEKYGTFFIDTVEQQMAYTDKVRQTATGICLANNVGRINTGDAWELYRAACAEKGIENNLCARLGNNNNQGDKSHDGDIGGGQYLNALVWVEVLTGLDCRDTTYIPTYTYSGTQYPMDAEMAEMLQEAAHKAVTEMLPTYPENAQ